MSDLVLQIRNFTEKEVIILPRVLIVGDRLMGTKELLFFDGRRGYKTDLGWYLDKSLAAACKFNLK